jgi:hypothetical protein
VTGQTLLRRFDEDWGVSDGVVGCRQLQIVGVVRSTFFVRRNVLTSIGKERPSEGPKLVAASYSADMAWEASKIPHY